MAVDKQRHFLGMEASELFDGADMDCGHRSWRKIIHEGGGGHKKFQLLHTESSLLHKDLEIFGAFLHSIRSHHVSLQTRETTIQFFVG